MLPQHDEMVVSVLVSKVLRALATPAILAKSYHYGLSGLEIETAKLLNELIGERRFKHEDFQLKVPLLNGFHIVNRHTGKLIAGCSVTQLKFVDIKDESVRSKFFPHEFSKAHEKELLVEERIHFFFDNGKPTTIVSEVIVRQISIIKCPFLDDDAPHHSIVRTEFDPQLNVTKITKERYEFPDMYMKTVDHKEYATSSSLEDIFYIENGFINGKFPPLTDEEFKSLSAQGDE